MGGKSKVGDEGGRSELEIGGWVARFGLGLFGE